MGGLQHGGHHAGGGGLAVRAADGSRISSASISARRTTGRNRVRAAFTSGLSGFTAVEVTTTWAPPRLRASWPMATGMPASRRRLTLAPSAMSLPCTE
jgi:hypothetical protein